MPSSKFGSKFFGERYQQYVDELTAEGTIDGEKLSPTERKEGFKKRNDKIDFQKFVEKVLDKKQSATQSTASSTDRQSLGGDRGGALMKAPKIDPGKLVPQQAGEETQENLDDILKGIDSILETLRDQEDLKKKKAKQDRRTAEKQKRKGKEDKLEGGIFKGLAKATDKVLKPVKSLFERIFDFIKTVILGRVIIKLLEWMGNPDNRKKLEAIGRFLKATWPALLAAYLLFGNSLGRFVTRLLLMTARFIPRIAATIVRLAMAHPIAAAAIAGAGLFVAGYAIPKMFPGTVDEQERKTEAAPGTVEEKIKALEEQKANLNPLQRLQGVGAEIDDQIEFLKTGRAAKHGAAPLQGFAGGGYVEKPQGFAGGGMAVGTDTVPAMLSPGEFVMSRGAVNKYGSSTLASMNAAGGGTNRPRMLGGTVYANGGGNIHDAKRKLPGDTEDENADIDPESGLPMTSAADQSGGLGTMDTPTVTPQTPIIPTEKDKKENTNMANAEQIAAAFLSTLEASGAQNASDAFQVMLNRTADAQAGGPNKAYGTSLFNQITAREQFSPYSSAIYGTSADSAAASKYGKIAKTLGENPAERKKKLLEIAGGSNGLQELAKLFKGGSASVAATVLADHQSNGNLSKKSREFVGNKVSFRGYHTSGAIRRGPGGNYFFGPGSEVGSLKKVSTGEQNISFSGGGGGDLSGGGGGGDETQSGMTDADQLKFAKAKFNYNEIREIIGTKKSAGLAQSISRSSRPSSTAAYQQQMQSQQNQQSQSGYSDEKVGKAVPEINADQMASAQKIQVLGIVT